MPFSDSINKEIERVVKRLGDVYDENAVRYAVVTDTHYDTKQSEGNEELIDNTIKIIRLLAEKGAIDFTAHCGDITTGWRSGEECNENTESVARSFLDFPCPVLFSIGNHDLNHNPDTKGKTEEQLDVKRWYDLTQKKFRKQDFVYDESAPDSLYFYTDIPDKKARIVCLQSFFCKDDEKQMQFIAEKVLTVKDDGFKYVFLSHAPIDIKYEEGQMNHVCQGNETLKKLIKALNEQTVAETEVGTFDFREFSSKAVAFNCGHMHNSYVEFNDELKMFHSVTGQTGCVGSGNFREVKADGQTVHRHPLSNDDANRYLFDIVSVTADKYERIRFGTGVDKTVIAER